MKCTCAQSRPWFMFTSEKALVNGVRTHINSKGKIPSTMGFEEGRTHDAASCKTASPPCYRLSYLGPSLGNDRLLFTLGPQVKGNILLAWLLRYPRERQTLGSIPACGRISLGRVIPVTSKLALQWLPCQAPGIVGSVLGLVGLVLVYCDWVK